MYKDSMGGKVKESKPSKRQMYLGATPKKDSDVGKRVIEQIDGYNLIKRDKNGEAKYFKSLEDGKWYDIKYADMSHKNSIYEEQLKDITGFTETGHKDAVNYWNTEAKSKEVRAYMTEPDNYYLEHYSYNRSDGANLKNSDGTRMTYDEPAINKCSSKGRIIK